jgi:hypothetical protein
LTEKKSGVECTHDNKAAAHTKHHAHTPPAAALKRKYTTKKCLNDDERENFSTAVIITLESELIILMPRGYLAA